LPIYGGGSPLLGSGHNGNIFFGSGYKNVALRSVAYFFTYICGSEIVVSQATKSIIKATLMKSIEEVMPFMATDVALTTIINGILTMGPIMLGRFLGGKIQDSAKNVPGYVQKLLTLSAAMAVVGALCG
jgi:hypothetical protein